MNVHWISSGVSAACLLLVVAGCKPKAPGAAGGPGGGPAAMGLPVVVAEARQKPVTESLTLVGSIAANESVEIKAETDGIITEIHLEEGQRVEQGALLLVLDETKLAATLAEADANLRLSETTFKRSQQLFQEKLISQQEYDQAAATFDRNRAFVDLTRRQLKDARVLAPFAGIIGARNVSPGQVISRNTVLTWLVDLDPVKVEFYVPERFLGQLHTGQKIEISVAAYPGQKFSGDVYFLAPQLDESTRRAQMKAKIPNPDHTLKPGMFANLQLTMELRPQAIVIPETALVWDGDSARVFLVQPDSTTLLKQVKLGVRLPGEVEIVEGLQAGQRVVTEGLQKIVSGMKVMPTNGAGAGGPPATKKAE